MDEVKLHRVLPVRYSYLRPDFFSSLAIRFSNAFTNLTNLLNSFGNSESLSVFFIMRGFSFKALIKYLIILSPDLIAFSQPRGVNFRAVNILCANASLLSL